MSVGEPENGGDGLVVWDTLLPNGFGDTGTFIGTAAEPSGDIGQFAYVDLEGFEGFAVRGCLPAGVLRFFRSDVISEVF